MAAAPLNMYALSAGEKGGNERKCEMGGTPSHVGGRASGREALMKGVTTGK